MPDREWAVLICQRVDDTMKVIDAGAPEHVEETDRRLRIPCTPGCEGRHLRLWSEPGKLHIEPGAHDEPPFPTDAGEALAAAYPSKRNGHPTLSTCPEFWPRPSILNQKLMP